MRIATVVGLVTSVFIAATAWALRDVATSNAYEAAEAVYVSLDEQQRAATVLPFDSPQRPAWHFIPKDERKGLRFGDMTGDQQDATVALLETVLSDVGYTKVDGARKLEGLVRELEGEGRRWTRDPDDYYLTLFGRPSSDGQWGLSFEGHHVSLNYVFENGRVVASTPQFLGAHPATVQDGQDRTGLAVGYRLLGDEADLAFALANSLTDAQRQAAQTSDKAPREIQGAGDPQPPYNTQVGIAGRELSPAQRDLLAGLIVTYAEIAAAPVAHERLIDIRGLNDVTFSYAGEMAPGRPHGYLVQGQTFVIEYVNTQPDAEGNPANHAHAIWRDMRGDFSLPRR